MLFDVVFFIRETGQHRWGCGELQVAGCGWRVVGRGELGRIMFALIPFKAATLRIDGRLLTVRKGWFPFVSRQDWLGLGVLYLERMFLSRVKKLQVVMDKWNTIIERYNSMSQIATVIKTSQKH